MNETSGSLQAGRIRGRLGSARIGRRLHFHRRIDSTNDEARRLARRGAPDGTVVVADEQTAGRGRRRRVWRSPAGAGLYLSVVHRSGDASEEMAAGIQLSAGIAVAETVAAAAPLEPSLRWPNDCYCRGRKLAGVLVEGEGGGDGLEFLVSGIGVNVNQSADDFPPELRERAASLRMLAGRPFDREPLLVDLLARLEGWEDVLRRRGIEPVVSRWLELSPGSRGDRVEVVTDDGTVIGRAQGLSARGGLLVRVAGGVEEITVGEVVRMEPTSTSERPC